MEQIKNNQDFLDKRAVGFELEFTGLEIDEVSELVANAFSGVVRKDDSFVYTVRDTEFGEFRIECDSSFLKDRKYADWLDNLGIELKKGSEKRLELSIAEHSQVLIPRELVSPPIPGHKLSSFYKLIRQIQGRYQNKSNKSFSLAPCGLHINIEVASLETDYLLSILRAFCLMYEDLYKEINVDMIRSLAPYIKPFPKAYALKILDPEYKPTQSQFIDDYFKHNPTRNRALDMSVIFAEIDADRLQKVKGLELNLIKPRPAFHYRLPNCELDNPDWSVATELERWSRIEALASKLRSRSADDILMRSQTTASSHRMVGTQ